MSISIFNSANYFMKLSETVTRKFEEVYSVEDYEIWTDTGWEDIKDTKKTIEYEIWELRLEDGLFLECADTHILFDKDIQEIFCKDLVEGDLVQTEYGLKKVISVKNTKKLENMYDLAVDSENHRYYTNNILSHNTQCITGYLLWYAIFQSNKTICITAQNEDLSKKILKRVVSMYRNLPFYLQQGAKSFAAKTLEFGNGSRMETATSKGPRGETAHLVFCDEFAFLPDGDKFYSATYPVISASENSKMIITSTPDGMGNEYFRIWEKARQKKNEFTPIRWKWMDRPGRDENFKKITIRNIGKKRWDTEYECRFLGASKTLIDPEILEIMTPKPIIRKMDREDKLRIYYPPTANHRYVLSADVADGVQKDYSTFSIVDITSKPYKQVLVYQDNKISPYSYHEIILFWARKYNNAYCIVENNARGAIVCKEIFIENEYDNFFVRSPTKINDIGFKTDRRTKEQGANALKDLIEAPLLEINDEATIKEFKVFEKNKLTGYSAANGHNDDLVMTLLIFAYLTTQKHIFSELEYSDMSIDEVIKNMKKSEIDESIIPIYTQGTMDDWNDDDDDDDGLLTIEFNSLF